MFTNPNIIPVEYFKLEEVITSQTIIKLKEALSDNNTDLTNYLSDSTIEDFNGIFMNIDDDDDDNKIVKPIDDDIFIKTWNMIVYYLYVKDYVGDDEAKKTNFELRNIIFSSGILPDNNKEDDNEETSNFKLRAKSILDKNIEVINLAKLLRLLTILY